MCRIMVLLAFAVLPMWAVANSGPYPYSQRDALGNVTVEGCLSSSAGNYHLVNDRGTRIKLEGKKAVLKNLVGERVRLSGTPDEVAYPGAMCKSMAENVTTVRVTSIAHASVTRIDASGARIDTPRAHCEAGGVR